MKIAISIPDPLFREAEAAAKDLGVSRSKLIQIALQAFLQRRRDEKSHRCVESLVRQTSPGRGRSIFAASCSGGDEARGMERVNDRFDLGDLAS